MKRILAVLLAVGCSAVAYSDEVLVGSDFDSWLIDRNVELSGTATDQTITDTAYSTLFLDQYNGSETLSRVVIRYIQPESPTSPDITGALSISGGSGSVTFTSASAEASTTVTATNTLVTGIYGISGTTIANPVIHLDSNSLGSFELTNAQTKPINMTYSGDTLLWDSNNDELTGSLDSVFKGSGSFAFDLASKIAFQYARNNTLSIQLNTAATDSGRIQIEYYAIPEPFSVTLAAIGCGLVVVRRRHLAKARAQQGE